MKTKKYYLHCVEPDQAIQNYEFIEIDDFLKKKRHKNIEAVFIGDLLEYFVANDATKLLSQIIDKLEKTTKIYIQGIDPRSVSQSFGSDEMSIGVFNLLIYGSGKKSIFTFSQIKSLLSSRKDIQIDNIKFMNSIHYYIECSKI